MKKTLFLSLALASCGLVSAETRLLNGVTLESGYFDVSKYLVRDPESGIIDSQTCAAVAASNMLAYWYSQNSKETVDAYDIYNKIFDYTKNASTTISADCNFYASAYNHATGPAVCTTATYVPSDLGYKVDVTPSGYDLKGSLYTSMTLQEAISWGLQNNLAMGLTMNQTPGTGAHALTIWGGEFESYGEGDPERLTAIYYTNSDDAEQMNRATFSASPNADGETEYYFNDGTNRRWKVVELTFLLDPYAKAAVITDTNPAELGAKADPVGYYTEGGVHENATSFNLHGDASLVIGENKELSSASIRSEESGFRATLSGSGTYIAENFDMGYAKLGKDWSGTVRLTGTTSSLSVSTLESASVNGSVAELSAASVGDWKESVATVKGAIRLTNDSRLGTPGLSLTDAGGTKNITFEGAISGTGDLRLADQKGGATHTYTFQGDVKEWTGSLRSMLSKDSELNIYFKENKEVNAHVENVGAGKVSVSFEKGAVINGDLLNLDKGTLTVTAEDGTTFNGAIMADTLVLNGQVTINDPATMSSAKSRPTGGGVANTEHFNVTELAFNKDSSLTFNGDFDLTGVTVTLSQDYLNALTAGSATTLISSAGGTLSGIAELSSALEGYYLELENGDLVLKAGTSANVLDLTVQSVLLTGNELTLTPMEALPGGLDLTTLDALNVMINSSLINELLADGADPNAMVSLTLGGYKDLTNVTFLVDSTNIYKGEGNGLYRLGNIPEPATATLSLIALAGLASRHRRR